jgi:hypothetical protein
MMVGRPADAIAGADKVVAVLAGPAAEAVTAADPAGPTGGSTDRHAPRGRVAMTSDW